MASERKWKFAANGGESEHIQSCLLVGFVGLVLLLFLLLLLLLLLILLVAFDGR